jgi:hypothetical protein
VWVAGEGEKVGPEGRKKGVGRAQAVNGGRLEPWDEEMLVWFGKKGDG